MSFPKLSLVAAMGLMLGMTMLTACGSSDTTTRTTAQETTYQPQATTVTTERSYRR